MGRAPTTQETNNRSEQPVSKSLADIAAMMAENREKMRAGKPDTTSQREAHRKVMREQSPDPQLGDEDEDEDEELDPVEELQQNIDDADEDEQEDQDEDEDTEEDEDEDTEEDEDETEEEPYDLSDDDLFEIEGRDEPVTFRELKDAFLADETIAQRLDEVAANHQQSTQAYTQAQIDAEKMQSAMTALMEHVVGLAAIPLVRKPDASLKQTDPAKYIQQSELWQQDQQRIQNAQSTVMQALEAHEQAQEELRESHKKQMMGLLLDAVPQLKDPKKKAQASKDIIDAAAHYGFKPEEVNEATDYRLFQMAHDAQQYRKLLAGSSTERNRAEKHKETLNSRPKMMRSKGTSAKQVATSAQKEVKRFRSKAKTSGKAQDVAAFMQAKRRASARP